MSRTEASGSLHFEDLDRLAPEQVRGCSAGGSCTAHVRMCSFGVGGGLHIEDLGRLWGQPLDAQARDLGASSMSSKPVAKRRW